MILGRWRDRFPRVTLTLPSLNGPLDVEFVVDTGFDGEIAVPESLARQLDVTISESRFVQLAGGFRQRCYSYELVLDWEDEPRLVEVLTLDGNPLVGNGLWEGSLIQAENTDGGEALFGPLT